MKYRSLGLGFVFFAFLGSAAIADDCLKITRDEISNSLASVGDCSEPYAIDMGKSYEAAADLSATYKTRTLIVAEDTCRGEILYHEIGERTVTNTKTFRGSRTKEWNLARKAIDQDGRKASSKCKSYKKSLQALL